MRGAAHFLENVFVIVSSRFTWWEMVGEEPSRSHQRTGPTEEGKGAKTGDRPSLRRGMGCRSGNFSFHYRTSI